MTTRIALLLLCCLPGLVVADQISCRAVSISEGDTFTCLSTENKRLRVRLAEIDAPERKQPYGAEAKQVLSDLILEKQLILHIQALDRYGRTLARAYVGDHRLQDAETLARNMGKGLWRLPAQSIVAPWDWRYAGRISTPQKTKPSKTASFSQFGGG